MSNIRELVSRNRREGEYMGRNRYWLKDGLTFRPRHARAGNSMALSLKGWLRRPMYLRIAAESEK